MPDPKRAKLIEPEPVASEVVVEEGPVRPDEANIDDHLDEDDSEDEDDEEHLSAGQLLKRHRADEFEEEEFDDDYY